MNERMQELYDQAFTLGTSGYSNGELDVEKFAELIVRECAEVCLAQRDPANLNYKPSVKFAEAVKEHFGVEL
jgi:hypothetical protein